MKEKVRKMIRAFPLTGLFLRLLETCGKLSAFAARRSGRQLWAFNAGNTFTGNPKWLFLYIIRHRPEIRPCWICDSRETVRFIRGLGYPACTYSSVRGILLQAGTDVYCVEQVKETIPAHMPKRVIMLNLYHGVGCKTVEKQVRYGFLTERIARKYIINNEYYMTHMLFLVTSELMEDHFIGQMGLKRENLIRAGYPRCLYQQYYEKEETFPHDLTGRRGLDPSTMIAAYVPTYRDDPDYDFWAEAMPDLKRLIRRLKQLNMLLIIKLHPEMLKDPSYAKIKETYGRERRLLFWDNRNDFYEIFDQIDVAVVDYSSIFYDLLAGGVPHFIRYFYDYDRREKNLRDFVFDIEEMTCGQECRNFDQLLDALGSLQAAGHRTGGMQGSEPDASGEDRAADSLPDLPEQDRQRIMNLFWSYSGKDSMDRIVDRAISFKPETSSGLPVLYSFGVFGTLVAKDAAHGHKGGQLPLIMENVSRLEQLVQEGETVVLISGSELPGDTLRRMLAQAIPAAADLPVFTAGDYGLPRKTKELYIKVWLSFGNYPFRQWIHHGCDPAGDVQAAREMGITVG